MRKIILVGLGNPGERYKNTPHNIGWMAIDSLSDFVVSKSIKKLGEYYDAIINNTPVTLIKPTTYVNNSGVSIEQIKKEKIIVLHDDTDLGLGKVRYKPSPYKGSHNGILSIQQYTNTFSCIRIGVCVPSDKSRTDYVTSTFSAESIQKVLIVLGCIKKNIAHVVNEQYDQFCSLTCNDIKHEMRNYRSA